MNQKTDGRFVARNMTRADLSEYLGFIATHATLAQDHLSAIDDAGALYSIKRMIAYVKAASGCANDLNRMKAEDAIAAHQAQEQREAART